MDGVLPRRSFGALARPLLSGISAGNTKAAFFLAVRPAASQPISPFGTVRSRGRAECVQQHGPGLQKETSSCDS